MRARLARAYPTAAMSNAPAHLIEKLLRPLCSTYPIVRPSVKPPWFELSVAVRRAFAECDLPWVRLERYVALAQRRLVDGETEGERVLLRLERTIEGTLAIAFMIGTITCSFTEWRFTGRIGLVSTQFPEDVLRACAEDGFVAETMQEQRDVVRTAAAALREANAGRLEATEIAALLASWATEALADGRSAPCDVPQSVALG